MSHALDAPPTRDDFYDDLARSHGKAWQLMADAVVNRRNPFRIFNVATVTQDGLPNVRAVVLRGADETRRSLLFHSDQRSAKFNDFIHQPHVMAQFYNASERIQLRLTGTAVLKQDATSIARKWAEMAHYSQECYRQPMGPGTLLDDPYLAERELLDHDRARGNLCLIEIAVSRLEWLFLASSGHRRAFFDYAGDTLSMGWMAP